MRRVTRSRVPCRRGYGEDATQCRAIMCRQAAFIMDDQAQFATVSHALAGTLQVRFSPTLVSIALDQQPPSTVSKEPTRAGDAFFRTVVTGIWSIISI